MSDTAPDISTSKVELIGPLSCGRARVYRIKPRSYEGDLCIIAPVVRWLDRILVGQRDFLAGFPRTGMEEHQPLVNVLTKRSRMHRVYTVAGAQYCVHGLPLHASAGPTNSIARTVIGGSLIVVGMPRMRQLRTVYYSLGGRSADFLCLSHYPTLDHCPFKAGVLFSEFIARGSQYYYSSKSPKHIDLKLSFCFSEPDQMFPAPILE